MEIPLGQRCGAELAVRRLRFFIPFRGAARLFNTARISGHKFPGDTSKFSVQPICPSVDWSQIRKSSRRKPTRPQSNWQIDFGTLFLYLCAMISHVQKTKQACLCCTCCMFASSGAGG